MAANDYFAPVFDYKITNNMVSKYSNPAELKNIDEIFELDNEIREKTRSLIYANIGC